MGEIIFTAIVTGFVLSIMIGPVFFVLLETSIRKGIRAALSFDLGVLVADVIYILFAYAFYSEVSSLTKGGNESILKLIGGSFLIIYGIVTFIKTPKNHIDKDLGSITHTTKDYIMLFIKGLLLNIANPMVIFYWFSVMAMGAKIESQFSFTMQMLLFIGILLTVFFGIDVLKIIGAKKLRPFINNKVLKSLSHITGSILFIFGLVLLFQGILSKM